MKNLMVADASCADAGYDDQRTSDDSDSRREDRGNPAVPERGQKCRRERMDRWKRETSDAGTGRLPYAYRAAAAEGKNPG